MWIVLVLIYGLLKGAREVVKKKSLEKSTVMEVLLIYTLLGFLMVAPDYKNAMGVEPGFMIWIAMKSFVIFLAWICSFKAINKMPISLYGVLDLSRVLFSTLLGTMVLGEVLSVPQTIGLLFVCVGLLMLKRRKIAVRSKETTEESISRIEEKNEKESTEEIIKSSRESGKRSKEQGKNSAEIIKTKYVVIAIISCMLNAVSGTMDKILMHTVNSSQLQFWYMLFLVMMYMGYILITHTKIRWKQVFQNYWIWILSIMFIVADRALFIANGMPDSRVTIMTLVKQSGCIVTILAGKYIFKEKNIGYKLLCAGIIVAGIVIAVL